MKLKRVLKWSAGVTLAFVLIGVTIVAVAYWRASGVPDWYERARRASPAGADENRLFITQNWLAGVSSGPLDEKPDEQKRHVLQLPADEVNELIVKWTGNLSSVLQDVRVRVTPDHITVAGYVKQQDKVVSVELRPTVTDANGLQLTLGSIRVGNQPVMSMMIPDDARQKAIGMMSQATPDKVTIDEHCRASREAASVYAAITMLELLRGQPIKPYLFLPIRDGDIVATRVRQIKLTEGHAELTLEMLGPAERDEFTHRLRDAVTQQPKPNPAKP